MRIVAPFFIVDEDVGANDKLQRLNFGVIKRMNNPCKVPVNIVTGFLGVGKTTALMNLLAAKPKEEFWAVVVNEFGEVGIDGASLSTAGEGLQVAEVPGGCVCCTTSPMLRTALAKIVKAQRPDRILIEPSGLGHPAGIVDLLREPMMAKAFEVRAVITLLDPRHLDDMRYTGHETWRDQIQLADVLVLNKCDLADVQQIERAQKMASALFPPKLALETAINGAFNLALLDVALLSERWEGAPHVSSHKAAMSLKKPVRAKLNQVEGREADEQIVWPIRKTHSSLDSHSCGWIFPPEQVFFSAAMAQLFESFSQAESLGLSGVTRAKAVLHTERDWYRFDWVDSMPSVMPAAWRRDSRIEVIVQSKTAPDWARLEQALLAGLIGDQAPSPS